MVLVTHDESTFYSNDCKMTRWCEETEAIIVPKGQGRSIMVSSFMCACHGTMGGKVDNVDKISRAIFIPGSNGEGYWPNKDLANQLKDVIPLFEVLHPNCVAIFAFDQSSNHRAMNTDALVASRMTSGPSEYLKRKTLYKFKNTKYVHAITGEEKD